MVGWDSLREDSVEVILSFSHTPMVSIRFRGRRVHCLESEEFGEHAVLTLEVHQGTE